MPEDPISRDRRLARWQYGGILGSAVRGERWAKATLDKVLQSPLTSPEAAQAAQAVWVASQELVAELRKKGPSDASMD